MTHRRAGSMVAAAALAALVAGMPAGAAARRNSLTATVDGKRIRFTRNVTFTVGGRTAAIFVVGQTRARLGGILRTFGLGCGDFPPATLPGASIYCTASYQEQRIGRHPSARAWAIPLATAPVTFDAYDGSQIAGHFSLVLQSTSGGPPITVEGQLHGRVRVGD